MRRFRLWGIGLAVGAGITAIGAPFNGWVDFPQFWYAGQLVGTPNLLNPAAQETWMVAHGYEVFPFLYPPGTAWLYAPLGWLPIAAAFWMEALLVLLIGLAAGAVAARTFDADRPAALIAVLAWAPVLVSGSVGHLESLGLLLTLLAIWGLRANRPLLSGLAVGGILFKPTLAVPLLAILLLRGQWKTLLGAAIVAAGWYLLGVAGSAGDWLWPKDWLAFTAPYLDQDVAHNVNKTIGLPELFMGHGAPDWLGYGIALALGLIALPRLLRAPLTEAICGACLVGLLVSPHSLSYEAVMAVPFIFWMFGTGGSGIAEPWRTRLLIAAYLSAELYVVSPFLGFTVFLPIVAVLAAVWISGWQRQETRIPAAPRPEPVVA